MKRPSTPSEHPCTKATRPQKLCADASSHAPKPSAPLWSNRWLHEVLQYIRHIHTFPTQVLGPVSQNQGNVLCGKSQAATWFAGPFTRSFHVHASLELVGKGTDATDSQNSLHLPWRRCSTRAGLNHPLHAQYAHVSTFEPRQSRTTNGVNRRTTHANSTN